MSFANFTTSKGNSAGLASGIPRKTNAFQVESHSRDSIDVTVQNPDSQFYKSSHVFKSSNAKGYTDNDGHLLSEEGPAYDKLAAYYPLDNLTNDQYADESGNNKHAKGYHIKPGMPGYKGCSTYFPGPFNSINFNGSNDYIDIPYNSSLDLSSGNKITLSAWVNPTSFSDYRTIISSRNSSDNNHSYLLRIEQTTGHPYIHLGNSAIRPSVSLLLNTWSHIVGTHDGTNQNFYINGLNVLSQSVSNTISSLHSSYNIKIGEGVTTSGANDSNKFKGKISDVRIYNTALTAEQISDIFNYGTILGHEVAHYKMGKTMGTNLVDSSGNGNDGTLNGGPTYAYGPYDASVSLPKEAFVFGEDDATVSVWMYAVSSDDKQIILSNNGYQQQFQFGIDKMSHETTYKKLFLKTKNTADTTTGYFLITETDFEPNRWYFLTLVRKDNNGYIYVDGIRCSTFNRSLTNMPKPVLHYKLDETSGTTAYDSSGNGYNGTLKNGTSNNQIGYDGTISAHTFSNNSSNYISIPNPSTDLSGNLTLSLWIKRFDAGAADGLISKDDTKEFELRLDSTYLTFLHGTDDPSGTDTYVYYGPTNSTFTNYNWYHIVVTRSGSGTSWTVKFYVDGKFINLAGHGVSDSGSSQPQSSTRNIHIGALNYNVNGVTDCFNGQMSDVRIYDKALTADQVNELYHERSSVYHFEEKTNLKLHLPLNHSLKDISGNGHHGSFIGGNPSYVENYKGEQNGALNFDGVNDYVDIGHVPAINFQRTDNFTINCWVNVDGISGSSYEYNDILGQMNGDTSNDRGWCIQQHLTVLYLIIRAGDAANNYQLIVYPNGYSFTVGVWTHLSIVFTGTSGNITVSNVKFYINGTNYSTTAVDSSSDSISSSYDFAQTDTSHGKFAIGARRWGSSSSSYFPGQISDVRIYDRALTNIEVERLYQSTLRVDEYSPGTRINNGNIGSDNSPISIGKDLTERFHYSGYLQQLKIYNCALNPTQIAELYHNYTSDKYHAPLENDNMLMNNENLLPESKYLLSHYKFDGNGNDETGTYNATATNSPEYKKYGVFDQSSQLNSKIVAVGWGRNSYGQLGIGDKNSPNDIIGNGTGEMGDNLKYANLGSGKYPVQISCGDSHTGAILDDGTVKCWGYNNLGQLGYGDDNNRGDESSEMGDNLPTVDLGTGRTAVQISCGKLHTCLLLDDGTVKCWGYNFTGQLGYGDTNNRGDGSSEMGDNLPTVDLGTGRTAVQISCGWFHTCAILDDGTVKCWGNNNNGQLGYGDTTERGSGSNEMGDNLPTVDLGTGRTAVQIVGGMYHTCAILDDGTVKCWGYNYYGQLGYGNNVQKNSPDNSPIDLGTGRTAVQISSGGYHNCVILDDGTVKCWGYNFTGQLGYGDSGSDTARGDDSDEMGDYLPIVNLGAGRTAVQISSGEYHTCVILDDGTIKCWGRNNYGQLGIENGAQVNSPNTISNVGSNLIKCIQLVTGALFTFIIGQYKGVGASTLTIANQQDYTISHEISNINSFSGWIKTDNISSGNLPIIYFNSNNYLYVDTSNNSLYFFSSDSAAGSQQNLYVNGNLVATSNTGGDITNSANSITASFNKNNKKITIDSQLQPVAHYKLDEGTGTTVLDSSGNGYNGTLTNGPKYTSNQNGIYGKALDFDGTNDYISLTTVPTSIFEGTTSFTISLWFNLSQLSNAASTYGRAALFTIRGNSNNRTNGFTIWANDYLNSGNRMSIEVWNRQDDNYILQTDENTITLNNWIHFVYVHTSTEQNVYLNGQLSKNATSSAINFSTTIATPEIGAENPGEYYLNGKISDVRIYDTTITATQVKQIYNNTLLSTNVTLNKDQLLYISDAVDSNNNGFKNITYSQNNKASNYETEITTNEYIDDENNDKISVQLGRIEPEKWYHVVLTTTSAITTSNPFYFGKQSTNYFSGCIDDFRLYKKVLTPDEVKHLYNRQLSGNSLALHLPLSEPNNTSLDDKSIYKHVTTNHGVESGDIGPVGGSVKFKPFGALSFDGSNDFVTNGSIVSSGLDSFFGRDAFTISLWINPDSVVGSSITVPISLGGKIVFNYGHSDPNYQKTWDINDGSGNPAKYTSTFVINTWYHLVAVFKKNDSGATNGYLKAYLNGILEATHNSVDQATTPTSNLFIGSYDSSNYRFNGQISDVRIYNTALTAEQVKAIYFNQTILGTEALHYKFNEKMGTTAFDSSDNGYDGTLTGGPTYYLSNPYRNYAMNFDGNGDYIYNNTLVFNGMTNYFGTTNFTISFWMYSEEASTASSQSIAVDAGYTTGVFYWSESVNDTSDRSWLVWTDSWKKAQYTSDLKAKTWYHILATYDNSNLKAYLNGQLDIITAAPGPLSTPESAVNIGMQHDGQYYVNGKISDFRIYDYPLDAEEVYKVYKTGEVFGTEKLHYTFNQAAGDQVLDQSGNGHYGTANGDATYQKVENPTLGSYLTVDSAERFNHSNGYLYPMYDISSKSHSFFCWMKLDENYTSGKHSNCIFSKVLNKNYVDMALSLNNGKLEFETKFNDNIDSSIIELYPTFLPNQWYHIGYSINYEPSIKNEKSGILKFYINGIMHTKYIAGDKRYTTSKNNSITTHNRQEFHNSKLYIGKRGDSSLSTFNDSTFRGCLSDFRFYETEITPIQARELFFNRNDGEIINTTHTNISENKLLEKTFDGTDILIGHWKLGVGISKVVLDNSKHPTHRNNHGFLMEVDSKRVEGITGSVPVFDGVNDYVLINPSTAISTIKSIAFWIKPAIVLDEVLINFQSPSIEVVDGKVRTYNFTSPSIYLNGQAELITTSGVYKYGHTDLIVNKWYHITVTSSTAVTTGTYINFAKAGSVYYNGLIDDVRFYNVVLTASQVNNLYGQNSTVNVPYNSSLVGKWLLNGDFKDSSGYNNDGVLSGNAKFTTGYDGNLAFKSNANNSTISVSNNYTTLRSISFWVYLKKLNQTILTTASGLYIKIELTGKINANGITSPSIYINGVKNTISTTTGDYEVPLNEWAHITITKSAVITGNAIVFGDNSFKGAIQNVEFYDTQLTDAQVKDIYKYGTYNNLVAHYKFNEGSGTVAKDSSKNNYHGTINGATYTSDHLGASNRALNFDGVDDYVTTGNINTGSGGLGVTTSITVSCWAKSDTENWNSTGMLISKRDSFILSPMEQGLGKEIRFYVYTSNWAYVGYTPSSITEWAFYTGIYDGTELKLYINGSLVVSGWNGTGTQGNNINNDTGQLYVGHDDGLSGRYFNGQISDVRIYNYALTADQVTDLYYENKSHHIDNLGYDHKYLTLAQKDTINNSVNAEQVDIKRDNLEVYLKFQDLGSTVVNDYNYSLKPGLTSYSIKNGTFSSSVTDADLIPSKDGIDNKALAFNGTSHNITFGTITFTQAIGGTISLWIKPENINRDILQLTSAIYLQLTNDFKLKLVFDNTTTDIYLYNNGIVDGYVSSGTELTSNTSLNPQLWNHIGLSFLTYNSTNLSANAIKLGLNTNSNYFDGDMDELKIYSIQLTHHDMYQLYLDRKTSPVVHLPMNESSGHTLCNIGSSKIDIRKVPSFKPTEDQIIAPTDMTNSNAFGLVICGSDEFIAISDSFEDSDKGVVYIFTYDGTTWNQSQKISSPIAVNNVHFGHAINMFNNTLAISIPYLNQAGDGYVELGSDSNFGGVYIYNYNGSSWEQTQLLRASDIATGDTFGSLNGISIFNNTMVISSREKTNSNSNVGKVYIFENDGSTWTESLSIDSPDTTENYYFGSYIKLYDNTLFIATHEDSNAGSIYVYQKVSDSSWVNIQKIVSPNPGNNYNLGYPIEIGEKNTFFAGEYNSSGGKVYVYNYSSSDNIWSLSQTITNSTSTGLGYQLSYYNSILYICDQFNSSLAGKLYLYKYNSSTSLYEEIQHLVASDGAAENKFSYRILASKLGIISTAINSNTGNKGSAYFFKRNDTINQTSTDIQPVFNKNCLKFAGTDAGTKDFYEIPFVVKNIKSVSFWINPEAVGERILFQIDRTNAKNIKIDSSDNITTTGFNSPTIFINGIKEGGSLTTIITNEWYHICVITSTGLNSINGQTFIGYDIPANSGTTSTKYFKGQMSDFRIYDCTLTNSEIQKIYQSSNIYKSIY